MRLLVAARDGARVSERLDAAGADVVRVVGRASEIPLALRADAIDAVVGDDELVDEAALGRLIPQSGTCAFLSWVGQASTARVADLLEAGADDVLHPGMGGRELKARIGGAIARSVRHTSAASVEFAGLEVDERHGEATWNGHDLRLTRRERQVLGALLAAEGRPVRREVLYREVWGFTMARGDRSVDVNVKRIRDKLAAAGSDVLVKTQPGVGYRVEAAAAAVDAVTAS